MTRMQRPPKQEVIPRMRARYTPDQLTFLRRHLPEYERRNTTFKRGEAKKYAHECAAEYIAQFGVPAEFEGSDEAENRLKEQIYNWYKNTTKRTRRKTDDRFSPGPSTSAQKVRFTVCALGPTSQDAAGVTSVLSPSTSMSAPFPSSLNHFYDPTHNLTVANLRDVFISPDMTDPSALSSIIQTCVRSLHTPTPLNAVVDSLFEAIHHQTKDRCSPPTDGAQVDRSMEPSYVMLRRFQSACAAFPATVVHAGVSGPAAVTKALQMKIRKVSVWMPTTSLSNKADPSGSMADELVRIGTDRRRRAEFLVDSIIHSVVIELGMLGEEGRRSSEIIARDAIWETDESEWLAGAVVLRGFIRSKNTTHIQSIEEYGRWMSAYEGRWREFRDDHRQAMMAEVLMGAKQDFARLGHAPLC